MLGGSTALNNVNIFGFESNMSIPPCYLDLCVCTCKHSVNSTPLPHENKVEAYSWAGFVESSESMSLWK